MWLPAAVRILQQHLGWVDASAQGDSGEEWDIFWTDTSVSAQRVLRLKPHQARQRAAWCCLPPAHRQPSLRCCKSGVAPAAILSTTLPFSPICPQRLNHFHGSLEICRKRSMALHLQRMAAHAPTHYAFFPTTFVLPADLPALLSDARAAGRRQAYILKPDAGCQVGSMQPAACLPAGSHASSTAGRDAYQLLC
jgi:tubulin polyglutamylase TTLL6/13